MWKGQKPMGVSEAQQAQFLTAAYRCLAADSYVGVALWFGMQDVPDAKWAAGYGLYPHERLGEAVRERVPRARQRHRADPVRRRHRPSGPEIRIAKPLDGAQFVDKLPIDARAVDSAGGVGIRRIETGPTATSSTRSATATRSCARSGPSRTGATASTR